MITLSVKRAGELIDSLWSKVAERYGNDKDLFVDSDECAAIYLLEDAIKKAKKSNVTQLTFDNDDHCHTLQLVWDFEGVPA